MALSNAERQRLFIQRLKAKAVTNGKAAEAAPAVSNGGVTVTISEQWRKPLAETAENLGIPADEYADFLMLLGNAAFNRKFQHGLTNEIAWWLIEMHSKYPDTFNLGSWEGSCNFLALDKLYEDRGVPIGKYQEWKAGGSPPKKIDLEAEKAVWKRAKRLGYQVKRIFAARTEYRLTKDGSTVFGGLNDIKHALDRAEAGKPIINWERLANGAVVTNEAE